MQARNGTDPGLRCVEDAQSAGAIAASGSFGASITIDADPGGGRKPSQSGTSWMSQ